MGKQTVHEVFDWCVNILGQWAKALGTTYEAINVWIFCIIWPIITLVLILAVVRLYMQNKRLRSVNNVVTQPGE